MVEDIFFMTSGTAGFVLPLRFNVVYIEINQGDYFGEIDIVNAANEKIVKVDDLFDGLYSDKFSLQRSFTVQAIDDCTLLSLSMKNLKRMRMQFNSEFNILFRRSDHCL